MMARRWTKAEEAALLDSVGVYGFAAIARSTDPGYDWEGAPAHRSRGALYAKLRRLTGSGRFVRGVWTLRQVLVQTGYGRSQVVRARRALDQKWRRTRAGGSYMITDEQFDDIVAWLAHDYWHLARRLYGCGWCGGRDRDHRSLGLCGSCYAEYRASCRDLGIPSGLARLEALALSSGMDKHDKYLDTVIATLRGRVPPTVDQLRRLAEWVSREVTDGP